MNCIISEFIKNQDGYARRRINGVFRGHHILVWEKAHGPVPKGRVVMHNCDNRACINLNHLSLGTQGDNVKDMHNKKRHKTGKHVMFPVREWIRELYRLGYSQEILSKVFSRPRSTIQYIVKGVRI